jgi:hypothetical protein
MERGKRRGGGGKVGEKKKKAKVGLFAGFVRFGH